MNSDLTIPTRSELGQLIARDDAGLACAAARVRNA
jgi:hypothetical protein